MFGTQHLVVFVVSGILLNLTPGQDTLYIVGRSLSQGRMAGLLTNLLNPKVALFFMAFLPQFVAPASESPVLSFVFLGAVFIFNGTLWCLILVWIASSISRSLRQHRSSGLVLKRVTGAIFVGLGIRLATRN